MNRRWPVAWALLLAASSLAGCPKPPQCPESHASLEALAAEYNANAAKIPRLWARARVRLTLSDEKGRSFSWGSASAVALPNAKLRLWKEKAGAPGFVLAGGELGTELFRVGTDAASGLYYLWYGLGGRGRAWLGRCELAGAPDIQSLPVDPLQLAEILCVTELPNQTGKLPGVVMTMQTDPCAHVVAYLKVQPVSGRLKVWREVWFRWDERLARRPFRIRLFDPAGRCRVIADVARYKPVEWDGPEDGAPVMPTDFRVNWPAIKGVQTAGSLRMTLSGMSTTRAFKKSYFDFESHLPAGIKPTQVDAAYGPIDRK